MKKYVQRLVLGLAIAAQFLAYQNCSKVNASDITEDGSNAIVQNTPDTPTQTCTDGKDITKPTKVFLVVDASASNYTASDPTDPTNPSTNWIGTDDNKVWRSKVLNAVIAKYGNNPHISFGLVSFKGVEGKDKTITAHIHAPDNNDQPIFTNDMAVVKAGIDDFMEMVEGPNTPTPSAVNSARSAIQADMAAHPGENATYQIILMTDGHPDARRYDVDRGETTALNNAAEDTQNVLNVSPGMIHFNAVFYYNNSVPPTTREKEVVEKIAEVGKGIFLIANTLPEYDFNIDTVLKFEPSQCE